MTSSKQVLSLFTHAIGTWFTKVYYRLESRFI